MRMRERYIYRKGERKRGRERKRDVELEYGCFIFILKRNDRCLGTF
jgi:hypothetical protein